jgi:DNA-binding LacI/PurR family transcriptional regulator
LLRHRRRLLDHLWERGRRRVALVVPEHDDAYPADVEAAYVAWCGERAVAPCTGRFAVGEYDVAERRVARELLAAEPRPDAVVGLYDASGVHLLEAVRDLGLRVPDDVAVASFGEDEGQAHADPPLTTVSLAPQVVAREAVELLLDVVHGRRTAGRRRLVPGELVVRASTSATPPS